MTGGEVPLGGNVVGAVRVGATVRRPPGPWTPAVHAVLRHLERHGVDAVPRVLGLDERGRDAYGLEDRRDLVDLLARRMDVLAATIRAWADAGDPAFAAMRGTEHEEGPLRDRAFVGHHRDELEAAIG